MVRVHTARAHGGTSARAHGSRGRTTQRKQQANLEATLREWCETRAHPRGRVIDGECFCGLVRYDD